MKIERPIFIGGIGRSGSTVFHEIFSNHPNVAWLSGLCDRYPERPSINRFLMKAIDYPIVGKYLKKKFSPWECYSFWEHHCKGFRRPCRDLFHEDVTNKNKKKIQNIMSQLITNKRDRLLLKATGWPRIGFLHEIFNDAKFIHVLRDGRAVVNSLINIPWWLGWSGPQNWRWGELTPAQREEWERHNKSFIALAAIQWKICLDALEEGKGFVDKDNFLEVKYENLCDDPLKVFGNVIEFCDLEMTREFEVSVKSCVLKNSNYKWQEELTVNQQNIIMDVLSEYLKKYGY